MNDLGGRENLLDCDGMEFRAEIKGASCEGKITVENGWVYLCQNERDGSPCKDRKGFESSWCALCGSQEDLRTCTVSDFTLTTPVRLNEFNYGDEVWRKEELHGRVAMSYQDVVVVEKEATKTATVPYTKSELINTGFTSRPPQIVLKLTRTEIAEKFGVKEIEITD